MSADDLVAASNAMQHSIMTAALEARERMLVAHGPCPEGMRDVLSLTPGGTDPDAMTVTVTITRRPWRMPPLEVP